MLTDIHLSRFGPPDQRFAILRQAFRQFVGENDDLPVGSTGDFPLLVEASIDLPWYELTSADREEWQQLFVTAARMVVSECPRDVLRAVAKDPSKAAQSNPGPDRTALPLDERTRLQLALAAVTATLMWNGTQTDTAPSYLRKLAMRSALMRRCSARRILMMS